MELDLPTLFITAVFASAVAGLLLLLSWVQNRNVGALALWAAAFLIGSVGVALYSERSNIPDVWSIVFANTIMSTAYGLMWGGARHFNGRPTSVVFMLAGAVIWLLACQVGGFSSSPGPRATLISAIIVTYSILCAWEFWRGRDEGLMSRLPIVVFLLAHAAIVIVRIPFAGSLTLPIVSDRIQIGWWTFVIFETVFFSFCAAYLLGGIARERVTLQYKNASLIDPLTGVKNRRAFLERGEKLLHRSNFERAPAALLLFDLDEVQERERHLRSPDRRPGLDRLLQGRDQHAETWRSVRQAWRRRVRGASRQYPAQWRAGRRRAREGQLRSNGAEFGRAPIDGQCRGRIGTRLRSKPCRAHRGSRSSAVPRQGKWPEPGRVQRSAR